MEVSRAIENSLVLLMLMFSGFVGSSFVVNAQTGFTSLVCGASSDYISESDGISWTSDVPYAPPKSIIFSLPDHSSARTLRSFPSLPLERSCYSDLDLTGVSLVRATFTYGNYDSLNHPPLFAVSIGATLYSSIDLNMRDPWVEEIIINSTEVQAFCLIAVIGAPVISFLELRHLPSRAYSHVSPSLGVLLKKVYRIDCGSQDQTTTRYPDDVYDRIWDTDQNYLDGSSTSTHSITHDLNTSAVPDDAPMGVLQSNRFNYHNQSLMYSLPLAKSNGKYLMNTYFGELYNKTGPTFKVSVNGAILFTVNGWPPLSGIEYKVSEAANWWWNVSLLPVKGAPQINGLELFETVQLQQSSNQNDTRALIMIEQYYNVQNILLDWVVGSDPCFPVPWGGVACSTEGLVVSLDVSNSELSGEISGLFQDFTSLEYLNTSGNNLAGQLPDLSGRFQSLKSLDLSNNQLSGTLDALSKLNLHYLNVANNQFSGPIPESLNQPGLILITSGNPCIQYNTNPCPTSGTAHTPSPAESGRVSHSTKKSRHIPKSTLAGIVIGVILGVLVIAATAIRCCRRYKVKRELIDASEEAGTTIIVEKELIPDKNAKRFLLKDLQIATNDFKNILGEGSVGPVYRGCLSDGTDVAIKMRSDDLQLDAESFLKEVAFLSKIRHKNLVELKGFCQESRKQLLVYEFMSGEHSRIIFMVGGPLSKLQPMNWEQRLSAAIGAASGLEHLHHGADTKIIHRNVKSSNILLGPKFIAKVSDFGLLRPVQDVENAYLTTFVKGTAGYLDPEYFTSQQLTEKSDVFSFGVVLMEILCGREPLSSDCALEAYNLVAWVRPALRTAIPEGNTSVLDKALGNQFIPRSLNIVADVALRCTEKEASSRPTMIEVVKELKHALDVEEQLPTVIEPSSQPSSQRPTQTTPKKITKQFGTFHSAPEFPISRSANIMRAW